MSDAPTFEAYLGSKKIDSEAFRKAEPQMWSGWKAEFEQMHANSFTVQKLNLINLVRRKYHQITPEEPKKAVPVPASQVIPGAPVVSRPGKPVIRPKRP